MKCRAPALGHYKPLDPPLHTSLGKVGPGPVVVVYSRPVALPYGSVIPSEAPKASEEALGANVCFDGSIDGPNLGAHEGLVGNPVRKDLSSVARRKGRGLHSFLISLWRLYLPLFFCFAAVLVLLFLVFFLHEDPQVWKLEWVVWKDGSALVGRPPLV